MKDSKRSIWQIKNNKKQQIKRASQILIQKGMINGEQHLSPLKNKIYSDEKSI